MNPHGSPPDGRPGCEVLRVEGLCKHFVLHNVDGRIVHALRGIDLTVRAGEHVALAGSSGAGKSTLLKCIYRTCVPTSGTVHLGLDAGNEVDLTTLDDRSLADLRGRELGYVSQFLRAPPRRSPLQIVTGAAELRGLSGSSARDASAESLRRLRLDEPLWDVYANALSGGEQQRVNLAAGTVSPPRALLLDEPVSALDPANRDAALALIQELTDQGVAVVGVFHDPAAMRSLATSVSVMRDGRVIDSGPPARIIEELAGAAP